MLSRLTSLNWHRCRMCPPDLSSLKWGEDGELSPNDTLELVERLSRAEQTVNSPDKSNLNLSPLDKSSEEFATSWFILTHKTHQQQPVGLLAITKQRYFWLVFNYSHFWRSGTGTQRAPRNQFGRSEGLASVFPDAFLFWWCSAFGSLRLMSETIVLPFA